MAPLEHRCEDADYENVWDVTGKPVKGLAEDFESYPRVLFDSDDCGD